MSKLMNSSYFISRAAVSLNAVKNDKDVKSFLGELIGYIDSGESFIEYNHLYAESYNELVDLMKSNLSGNELKTQINLKLVEVLCNLSEIQLDKIDRLEKKVQEQADELGDEDALDDLYE